MKTIAGSVSSACCGLALRVGLAGALVTCAALAQAKVTPPPLPPGSALVKVHPGMSKDESNRQDRAHHHKGHVKKDIRRDDSASGNNGNNANGGRK